MSGIVHCNSTAVETLARKIYSIALAMAAAAGGNDLGAGGTNMEISYKFSPFVRRQWHRLDAVAFFNRVLDLLFKLLIFFVVLVLAMGLIKMFLEVWSIMVARELNDAFGFIVTNLLTFFIILELFKSLVEYFREHRLKLTFIVDATLVFILREVMIGLYQHQNSPSQIGALAFLALMLGAGRTLAIVYSPMERKMVESLRPTEKLHGAERNDAKQSQPRCLASGVIQ